jgi:GNAT superfamily N-acetyltransferase
VAEIRIAETDAEIADCFPVMRQLRPHLVEDEFVARIRLQEREGFRLAALRSGGAVRAVAGYRVMENLVSGRLFYVDDLVTDEAERSRGYGDLLFQWLVARARELECDAFELDSGVHRHGAHRFYLLHRMDISSHHFRLVLRK